MATLTRAVYKSISKGLRVQIRPEIPTRWHPSTGAVLERLHRVYAEFGVFGPEQPYYNQLTGEMDTAAMIVGGYYDVDQMAKELKWDDELKEEVIRVLDEECQLRPGLLQRIEHINVPAPRPWPTYDDTDPDTIIKTAALTGTSAAAAAYERENLQRAELLEKLDADAETQPEVEQPEPVVAISDRPQASDDLTRITL